MQIAQGDLRKAQIHIDLYSGLADKGAHVYFGTRDVLCRGIQSLWTTMTGTGSLKIAVE